MPFAYFKGSTSNLLHIWRVHCCDPVTCCVEQRLLTYCWCKLNISYCCSCTLRSFTGQTPADFYYKVVPDMQCLSMSLTLTAMVHQKYFYKTRQQSPSALFDSQSVWNIAGRTGTKGALWAGRWRAAGDRLHTSNFSGMFLLSLCPAFHRLMLWAA